MLDQQAMTDPDRYVQDVEIRVLGPIEVLIERQPTTLGAPKQRAVLGTLTSDIGNVVSVDHLVNSVWGEAPPPAVRRSLHTYISNLRSVLGGNIERAGNGYRLTADPSAVDANVFERTTDEGRSSLSANPSRAADTLRAGLSLWRGRPYADLIDVPGLQDEIRRLEDLRGLAVEARIDADLAIGRHRAVIGELETLTAEHPLNEGLRARHMMALYRDGRQADALRAYQKTREMLATELGLDPSPELQQMEERILLHDPDLLAAGDSRMEEIAFLFTDLEGSTALWETRPEQMRDALTRHDEIISDAVAEAGGRVFKHTGDGVLAAFATAAEAAAAGSAAQRVLHAAEWGTIGPLTVRMSVDVGEVDVRGGDYYGAPMNRGARLMSSAHGGQIVLSASAHQQLEHLAGVQIKNLGEHRFKGLGAPQQVFQLLVPELANEFPALRTDAAAPSGREFGDAIRGYEIRERVGVGRFGIVYRAYQPTVGREVAVKVIRPEFANHPAFVRRFEAEARTVAKLEHPHIVSLYDFWRDHEGAYLVMPYLAGKSLAGAPYGAMPDDRVGPILRQIGAALSYAHRQGVIHRDVKPANLLLDGDGNAYLADFGIAVRAVEQATGLLSSSQAFRAPEDRDGGAIDERADVYSLAGVSAEMLTGTPPPEADLSSLTTELRAVIERGMETDPANRFSTIDEFMTSFAEASGEHGERMAVRVPTRNPYKGLAAFDESDARDFFGRDTEITALLTLVASKRLATVVGPSGSGKSSLVRAGLLPALRSGRLPGSASWLIVTMVPGAHPFDELATALGEVASEPLRDMAAELRSDEHGLLRLTKKIMRDVDGELVVVVDQFEELYSLVRDEAMSELFIQNLVEATGDPHSRVRVVTTVRADFFDQPLLDDRLGPIVADAHLALSVPTPDALREAIERPAEGAGVRLEAGLSLQVVADVRDEPGGLPLMQFALADLVQRAESGDVALADYTATGGVTGALSNRASAVYDGLSDEDRKVAEQIFVRMVSVSDDTGDVRRRVRRSELESLGYDAGSVGRVLDAFGSARLLTFDRDPVTRGPTVEVAHEALLREWDQYSAWIADRRGELLTRRRFELAMAEWEAGDRPDDHLPSGGRLTQFEEWATSSSVQLTASERRFLDTGVARREDELASRRRYRRRITTGFAVAALVASSLAVAAQVQRGNAQRAAALAAARELILEAEKNVEIDPELSTLLAIEAFEVNGTVPAAAVDVLREAIAANNIVFRVQGGGFAAMHPDNQLLATKDGDNVAVWSITTGEVVERYASTDGATPTAGAFSPDGSLLAVGYDNAANAVRIWDRSTGEFTDISGETMTPGTIVDIIEFRSDGEFLSVGFDGSTELWTMPTATQLLDVAGGGLGTFDGDGNFAYGFCSSDDQCEIRLFDPDSGATTARPFSTLVPVTIDFSPTGQHVLVADPITVVVLDVSTWQEVARTDVDRVGIPRWLPDGSRLLTSGESGTRVIDAMTGEVLSELHGLTGPVLGTDVSSNGRLVAVPSSFGGETVIYDVSGAGGAEVAGWTAPMDNIWNADYSSDGERIVLSDGGSGRVETTHSFLSARAEDGTVQVGVAGGFGRWFPWTSQSGDLIAFLGTDGNWSIRQTNTGHETYSAPASYEIHGVDDRGDHAVITDSSRTRLVSTIDGAIVADLDMEDVGQVVFNPTGTLVAVKDFAGEGGMAIFDVETGRRLAYILPGDFVGIVPAFTADGSRFIMGGFGPVYIFDLELLISGIAPVDALQREIPAHENLILRMAISPDDSLLLTSSLDEPLKLWDLETFELLGEFGGELEPQTLHNGDFHPTLPHIVVASPPNQVRIHTLDFEELKDIAREKLTRGLTADECLQYLQRECDAANS